MRVQILRPILFFSVCCVCMVFTQIAYGNNGGPPNPCVQSELDPDTDSEWIENGIWFGDGVCDWVILEITPPADTQDGSQSGNFTIGITSKDPDSISDNATISYSWNYSVPDQASRTPTSDIFDNNSSDTPKVTTAQWFSTTGSKWQQASPPDISNPDSGAPMSSPYDISCEVTINGASGTAPSVQWSVFIPGPGVVPPSVSGTSPDSSWEWVDEDNDVAKSWITGSSRLSRTGPQYQLNGFEETNSFADKIVTTHEAEHVDQWNNQDPWKRINNITFFMNEMSGKSYTGTGGFMGVTGKPRDAWQSYKDVCSAAADRANSTAGTGISSGKDLWYARERAAHGLSNDVDPDYLEVDLSTSYQLSGTASFNWSSPSGWSVDSSLEE